MSRRAVTFRRLFTVYINRKWLKKYVDCTFVNDVRQIF